VTRLPPPPNNKTGSLLKGLRLQQQTLVDNRHHVVRLRLLADRSRAKLKVRPPGDAPPTNRRASPSVSIAPAEYSSTACSSSVTLTRFRPKTAKMYFVRAVLYLSELKDERVDGVYKTTGGNDDDARWPDGTAIAMMMRMVMILP
jgi:hypothetical protein